MGELGDVRAFREDETGMESFAFQTGDPHFRGFDGESFDFMGEPDKYYNLLTDTDVHVNAYFVYWATSGADNFTSIERIGIRVNGHRVQISPAGLTIDGRDAPDVQGVRPLADGTIASIERFARLDDQVTEPMRNDPAFGDFIRGYAVKTTCGYEFVIVVSTDHVNPPYLNILCKMSRPRWPHGVIGQTADHDGVARQGRGHNGEGVIEGTYTDYEVSSLWDTDFKFNRYQRADWRHIGRRHVDRWHRLAAHVISRVIGVGKPRALAGGAP